MCGRYFIDPTQDEIKSTFEQLEHRYGKEVLRAGEIYPTNNCPVYVDGVGLLRPELMTWGFPQYKGSGVIINARAETAEEKPTFRQAVQMRRCVVISSGFYEWDKKGKEKSKYLFTMPEQQILYMAGLFNSADPLGRFVILTTDANESMENIHDRMPVIISKTERELWVKDREFALNLLRKESTSKLIRNIQIRK